MHVCILQDRLAEELTKVERKLMKGHEPKLDSQGHHAGVELRVNKV